MLLIPWQPTQSSPQIKRLGKLLEELGELTSVVSRCLIQGIDESEPVTQKPNREWLEDEIADVMACIDLTAEFYFLDAQRIAIRTDKKKQHLEQWFAMEPK